MAKKAKAGTPCPVCQKPMPNKGALAAHLKLAKDSAHVAHRAAPPAPPAEATPPAAPAVLEEPKPEPPAEPVVEVKREFSPALAAAAQQKAEPDPLRPAPVVVSWTPPAVVQPLAGPAADGKPATAASPTGDATGKPAPPVNPTVSEIPLEPFLAQAMASVLNAFALDPEKGDRLLTQQEVGNTGFPKAVEVSVRKYWPDLPLDHPVVLLTVSGTALVGVVKAHRAPRPKKGEPTPRRPAPADEPAPAPVAYEDDDVDDAPAAQAAPVASAAMSPEAKAYAAMLAGGST